jgi:hypothetical protein
LLLGCCAGAGPGVDRGAQRDEVGLLALLVHDAEPDVLQRTREAPGPDGGRGVGVHHGGGQRLGEAVQHGGRDRSATHLAGVAHGVDEGVGALPPQVVQRPDAAAVPVLGRGPQLVAEVRERLDLLRVVPGHVIDHPGRDRRFGQALDPLGAQPVATVRRLPGGGVAGSDELVEGPGVERVDGGVEVCRVVRWHGPTVARRCASCEAAVRPVRGPFHLRDRSVASRSGHRGADLKATDRSQRRGPRT